MPHLSRQWESTTGRSFQLTQLDPGLSWLSEMQVSNCLLQPALFSEWLLCPFLHSAYLMLLLMPLLLAQIQVSLPEKTKTVQVTFWLAFGQLPHSVMSLLCRILLRVQHAHNDTWIITSARTTKKSLKVHLSLAVLPSVIKARAFILLILHKGLKHLTSWLTAHATPSEDKVPSFSTL